MTMVDYSEEVRALFGLCIGSPVITCKCGRQVFGGNGTDMDEGELEKLQAGAKAEPNRYCEHHGCDGVVAAHFNGGPHVFGCDCGWEKRLVEFLDQNERAFVEYYKRKVKRVQRQLMESAATLSALAGVESNPKADPAAVVGGSASSALMDAGDRSERKP